MKRQSLVPLVALALFVVSTVSAQEGGFSPLFDGKTLKGWEGNKAMFRVEKQAIVGGSLKDRIPRNEFLCTTTEYEDFELRLSAKLIG